MSVLSEIKNWKLDAKFEESNRYFFHIDELGTIQNGDKCYVIGRKGSGKTAISENIYRNPSYDIFTDKLTFKNFPFNELYEMENTKYTPPNQYISLWKYLIYSTICRMMTRNENIDPEIRATLETIFGGKEPIINLRRTIQQWTAKEYSISVLGVGGKVSLKKSDDTRQSWIERVDIIEDVLVDHLDDSFYYISFDELDEDYKNIVELGLQNNYLSLITSLFKAIQDVRSIFFETGKNIRPIIFLRDDIYDLILDPDKNKWNDFRIDLDWKVTNIQKLIAFRISRSIKADGVILPFAQAWNKIFTKEPVAIGHRQKKKIKKFDYITRSTHLRPRDYVRYIQASASEALDQKRPKITPGVVKKVDKGFSNYLRNELVDEIHGVLPDIQEIFSIFSEIRKWALSTGEFRKVYMQRLKSGIVTTKDPDFVLKILFHFSVLGNQSKGGVHFFRYKNIESRFNFKENIVIHRGLFKALQII